MNESDANKKLPSRTESLFNISRKGKVVAALGSVLLTSFAVGAAEFGGHDKPETVEYIVPDEGTISGAVVALNPGAEASDVQKIADEVAVDENLVGHEDGVQPGSILHIPVYPEFAQHDSQN